MQKESVWRDRPLPGRDQPWLLEAVVNAAEPAQEIEAELNKVGSPERATAEKRYLKSDLTFLGASLAQIRTVAKSIEKEEQLERGDLIVLVRELWSRPIFECRKAAVIHLELHASELGPQDLPVIETLIRESKTWALVDDLAGHVVGEIALRHDLKQKLDEWAKDDDFWIRRSALLAELKPLRKGSAFQPFLGRADAMLEETEFFIRKAIGWVLRETSKKRPREVYEWLAPRTHRASGVTMREAVKYLNPQQTARLMRAYKAGLPAV